MLLYLGAREELEVSMLPGNYLEVLPPFDGEARERRVSQFPMAP